ncbi:MAG: P-II family nitrogen regulator [Deltaproteobacteria bacterium]|nr:P-II family nitrogen regulator [Deltaproteobacteria bacterium]
MKFINAYIKPERLTAVTLALRKVEGLTGMSVFDCRGFGRTWLMGKHHHAADDAGDFVRMVKIEIICQNQLAEAVVSALEKAAHTGLRGDGKIFTVDIDSKVRIGTGERWPVKHE